MVERALRAREADISRMFDSLPTASAAFARSDTQNSRVISNISFLRRFYRLHGHTYNKILKRAEAYRSWFKYRFLKPYPFTVSGVNRITFIAPDSITVSPHDFTTALRMAIEKTPNFVNITISLFDSENHLRNYSLSRKRVFQLSKQGILNMLDEEPFSIFNEAYESYESKHDLGPAPSYSLKSFSVFYVPSAIGSKGRHDLKISTQGGFKTCSIPGNENDCLITSLRYSMGSRKQARTIRHELNFHPFKPLGTAEIPALEEYFKIAVNVYGDDNSLMYVSPKNIEHFRLVELYYNDDHYSLITEHLPYEEPVHLKQPSKRSKVKYDVESTIYVDFDFETVYDIEDGHMMAYCISMGAYDYNFNIVKPYKAVIRDDLTAAGVMVDYLNEVESEFPCVVEKSLRRKKFIIGFNCSRFDNFLLMSDANRKGCFINPFFANNSILRLGIDEFETWDLCRILSTSLKAAAEAFKLPIEKGELAHHEVQEAYVAGKLPEYLKKHEKRIEEYAIRDVELLRLLHMKLVEALPLNVPGSTKVIRPEDFLTLGAMAVYFATEIWDRDNTNPYIAETPEQQKTIELAKIGGRSQVFNRLWVEDRRIACVDVVSQYPFNMKVNPFPCNCKPEVVKKYQGDDVIGLYNIRIVKQPNFIKVLPRSTVPLDWTCCEPYERVTTNISIKALRELGAKIIIKDGIVWRNTTSKMFSEFVQKWEEIKNQQDTYKAMGDKPEAPDNERYNPALRHMAKMLLNILSGKQIQKCYEVETKLLSTRDKSIAFKRNHKADSLTYTNYDNLLIAKGKVKKNKVAKNSVLNGILIYEYSRTGILTEIFTKVDPELIYACETDSCFMAESEYLRLKEENPAMFVVKKKEFGMYEEELQEAVALYRNTNVIMNGISKEGPLLRDQERIELNGPFGIFISRKCYCTFLLAGKPYDLKAIRIPLKMAFKGVRVKCGECDKERVRLVNIATSVKHLNKLLTENKHLQYCANLSKVIGNKEYADYLIRGMNKKAKPGEKAMTLDLPASLYYNKIGMMRPFSVDHFIKLYNGEKLHILTSQIMKVISSTHNEGACIKQRFLVKQIDCSTNKLLTKKTVRRNRADFSVFT